MFPWERKKQLTKKMRQVLDMKLRGYTAEEIGAALGGVKPESINSLASRARKRQRELAA